MCLYLRVQILVINDLSYDCLFFFLTCLSLIHEVEIIINIFSTIKRLMDVLCYGTLIISNPLFLLPTSRLLIAKSPEFGVLFILSMFKHFLIILFYYSYHLPWCRSHTLFNSFTNTHLWYFS